MKNAIQVGLDEIRQHEANQARLNVSLGSYHMPPAEEFVNWLVVLEDGDLERLFLLSDFMRYTVDKRGKLKGVVPKDKYREIVDEKLSQDIDLRVSPRLAPVLVCANLDRKPLSIIDGNHRATAHYLKFQSIEGMQVYVCVHNRISTWRHLAPAARLE